ncbi:hypothetical protein Tsubulata_049678 [Turnera subulata]|uniref:DUF4283 domain-containing protein n=1 Tax=Turnera subulata TaxID=218843 RepID=A0A9Q0JN65_9ROSI|nr:hypothetical protein Tsubulata_049678 [Turnera subulata]
MVSYERLSWLTCYGIPLHVWDKEFLKNFGSHFGKFLGVDASTAEKESFECAKILICTDRREPAKHVQRISVDDKFFDIVIFEEIIYELGQIVNSRNINIVSWGFDSDSDCPDDSSLPPSETHLQPPVHPPSSSTINAPSKIVESTYLGAINSPPSQDIPSQPPPSFTSPETLPKQSPHPARPLLIQSNSNPPTTSSSPITLSHPHAPNYSPVSGATHTQRLSPLLSFGDPHHS